MKSSLFLSISVCCCLLSTSAAVFAQSTAASEGAEAVVAPRPCSWAARDCVYPHWVVGLDLGVSHFAEGGPFGFSSGTGSIASTGPAWGLRAGLEIAPWFALEAHYIGLYNRTDTAVSNGERRGLLTTAGAIELRFTVPTPVIQPYLFFGPGIYSTSVSGSAATTQLTGSTEFGIPVGIGFLVPLPKGLSIGAEGTYHRLFGESFAADEEISGADPVSATAVLRARL